MERIFQVLTLQKESSRLQRREKQGKKKVQAKASEIGKSEEEKH